MTDTDFFDHAEIMDTKAGQTSQKGDPALVAKAAFGKPQAGPDKVTPTVDNKIMGVVDDMLPEKIAAQVRRGVSRPGSEDQPSIHRMTSRACRPSIARGSHGTFARIEPRSRLESAVGTDRA